MNANSIQVFKFDEKDSIRTTVNNEGNPWFVGRDVAEALGYARARDAIKAHCKGAVKYRILTNGGEQDLTIIPERDVYRLIMRSKLPTAERFEEWVVGEVLPSIRKTGSYSMQYQIPKTYAEALRLAAKQTEELEKAQEELTVTRPKAALVDEHYGIGYSTVSKFARTLEGVNIKKVKQKLKELGYLYRACGQYRVYSKYKDNLFVEKFNPHFESYNIHLTRDGEMLLVQLYQDGELYMKRGYEKVC